MNRIELSVLDVDVPDWAEKVKVYAAKVMEVRKIDAWELSIVLTGDDRIRDLNREYRGKDEPTDILSFDPESDGTKSEDGFYIAGDMVISVETLKKNAEYFSVPLDEELRRLVIHGILHLAGMDHASNDESEPMLVMQEKILEEMRGDVTL